MFIIVIVIATKVKTVTKTLLCFKNPNINFFQISLIIIVLKIGSAN